MTSLFQAFAAAFVVIAFVTLIWPLNVPIVAGAYRVYHQGKAPAFEQGEFWVRSTLAALGLAVLTVVFLFIQYILVEGFEFKEVQGPIVVALFMLYLPIGAFYVF